MSSSRKLPRELYLAHSESSFRLAFLSAVLYRAGPFSVLVRSPVAVLDTFASTKKNVLDTFLLFPLFLSMSLEPYVLHLGLVIMFD